MIVAIKPVGYTKIFSFAKPNAKYTTDKKQQILK
jgi:hypothetical protein